MNREYYEKLEALIRKISEDPLSAKSLLQLHHHGIAVIGMREDYLKN